MDDEEDETRFLSNLTTCTREDLLFTISKLHKANISHTKVSVPTGSRKLCCKASDEEEESQPSSNSESSFNLDSGAESGGSMTSRG